MKSAPSLQAHRQQSVSVAHSLPNRSRFQMAVWLTFGDEQRTVNGEPYQRVYVDDATGHTCGFVYPHVPSLKHQFGRPGPAFIAGHTWRHGNKASLLIRTARPLPLAGIQSVAELFPRRFCPEAALPELDRLAQFERSLATTLRHFLQRVLLDDAIRIRFIQCKGSQAHHHAYKGGLLVHSTHLLDVVGQMTRTALPNDPKAVQLTQLGYLLHDLGKIRTVGSGGRPSTGRHVRHEFQTALLLGPHLSTLEEIDPETAATLTYILDFINRPAHSRGQAKFLGAEIVVACDHLSAASVRGRGRDALLSRPPKAANDSMGACHARRS